MINNESVKAFCCQNVSLIENYDLAIADTTQTWHVHHRREISENKSRKQLIAEGHYYKVKAEELIFLTKSEHMRLHNKGKKHTEETRMKMRERLLNISVSTETRDKLRAVQLGMHWYNNGEKNIRAKEPPDDTWKLGRLWGK